MRIRALARWSLVELSLPVGTPGVQARRVKKIRGRLPGLLFPALVSGQRKQRDEKNMISLW
jgi:hypothetical protein